MWYANCFSSANDFGRETLFRKARVRNGIKGNGVSVWQQLHAVGPDLSRYRFVARMRNKHDFRTRVAMCDFQSTAWAFYSSTVARSRCLERELRGKKGLQKSFAIWTAWLDRVGWDKCSITLVACWTLPATEVTAGNFAKLFSIKRVYLKRKQNIVFGE